MEAKHKCSFKDGDEDPMLYGEADAQYWCTIHQKKMKAGSKSVRISEKQEIEVKLEAFLKQMFPNLTEEEANIEIDRFMIGYRKFTRKLKRCTDNQKLYKLMLLNVKNAQLLSNVRMDQLFAEYLTDKDSPEVAALIQNQASIESERTASQEIIRIKEVAANTIEKIDSEWKEKYDKMAENNEKLESKNEKLKSKNEGLIEENEDLQTEYEEKIKKLKKKIKHLKIENDDLIEENEKIEEEREEKYRAEIDSIRKQEKVEFLGSELSKDDLKTICNSITGCSSYGKI